MTINTATKNAFIANAPKAFRNELELSNYVRNETLNRAYATAGYLEMSNADQLKVYDAKRAEIIAELGLDW